jgi:hypothetical protein
MMNTLLQSLNNTTTLSTINDTILQYGILGIVALILSYFAYNQFKRLTEKNEKLEQKVDTLQKEMMKLIVEEKDKLSLLISENTKALNELRSIIIKFLLESDE